MSVKLGLNQYSAGSLGRRAATVERRPYAQRSIFRRGPLCL
jgi:hypothetical protein